MFRIKLPAFLFLLSVLVAPASWAAPTKILPLGDSITSDGGDSAYRDELFDRLTTGGYDFEFVGSLTDSDATTSNLTKHEGHSGWRADEILNGIAGQGNITTWLQGYTPDIALVHLGTNDLIQLQTGASTLTDLELIITKLRADNTNIRILIAKIIPLYTPDFSTALNTLLTDVWADNQSTATSTVTIVDQNSALNLATDYSEATPGQIHPNLAGEAKMAKKWFDDLLSTNILAPKLTLTSPVTTSDGPTFTVVATSSAPTGSSGAITYSTNSTGICAVDPITGEVTPQAAGNCVIDATQAAVTNYAEATADPVTIVITDNPQTVTFAAATPSVKVNGDAPFAVSATSSSTLDVTITSTTPAVCTINPTTQVVTILDAGTCTLSAIQPGDVFGIGAIAKIYAASLPVTTSINIKQTQVITFATNTPTSKTFGNADFTVNATSTSGLAVSISSTTQNVCTINAAKSVSIVSAGTCILSASQAGNTAFAAATTVTQTISISSAGQSITFTSIPDTVIGSAPITLEATASSGLPVTFSSSTTTICTVSGDKVTLLKVGTCNITATAGNSNTTTATASNSFEVTPNTNQTAYAAVVAVINGTSAEDVTTSQLTSIGLTGVKTNIDYTQALIDWSYANKGTPTTAELQSVIDSVNNDSIKTAGSLSGIWLSLFGFAALLRRNRLTIK